MLARLARRALLGLAVALACAQSAAIADDLADFNAAAEAAESHNRVVLGYLRNDNIDLAGVELDRLRAAWADLLHRFAGKRPAIFDGNALYGTVLTDISTRLVTADMMLNSGRPQVARQALDAIRADLYNLRKSAGIKVLADCVRDADAAMEALLPYNDPHLDWQKPTLAGAITEKVAHYAAVLGRCDEWADATVRANPDFRRLIDGSKASLNEVKEAVATRDADLLHRLLDELRSYDRLLAFRFG